SSIAKYDGKIFSATTRLSETWRALKTVPIPPAPIFFDDLVIADCLSWQKAHDISANLPPHANETAHGAPAQEPRKVRRIRFARAGTTLRSVRWVDSAWC